jgi:carboxynorspermidine decarboxylase
MDAGRRDLPSPLMIYDLAVIDRKLRLFKDLVATVDGALLYSIKAQPFEGLLRYMAPGIQGFSVSSPFEAQFAESIGRSGHVIHLTSPGVRDEELAGLKGRVTHLHFNSLEQFKRLAPKTPSGIHLGLRINPGLSSIDDDRYNPCRTASKLGVPLHDLQVFLEQQPMLAQGIEGLHFHTHFRAEGAENLEATLHRLKAVIRKRLTTLRWINLGGGYAPRTQPELDDFKRVLMDFKKGFEGLIVLEPGFGLVGEAGSLRSKVIDRVQREGVEIAVLDTGVHHLPEVFEYQRPPKVREAGPLGSYPTLLAGNSCLAGDLLGLHPFKAPLAIGDTITFEDVGAYAMVKASRFNGHDLPGIAFRHPDGRIEIVKTFGYPDFHQQWTD